MSALRLVPLAATIAAFAASACSSASSPKVSDAGAEGASPGHDGSAAHAEGGGAEGGADGAAPIVAPDDTWTWVPIEGSKCASGSATGIGVNPHAGATELVVYFEGGGQCTDATTCWGSAPTASNVAGYGETTFLASKQLDYPPLVRTHADNPFAAMNLVYIPYCTGDLHFGTIETSFTVSGAAKPTYFWGAKDMDLFLARLVPTFPGTTHVYSYGTSAGGFGSYLNFDRLVKAFGVRVDVLDDSGPPLTEKGATDNAYDFKVWGFVSPTGCTACDSYLDIMKFDRATQPASKIAFLSFAEDTTISVDFGYSLSAYGPAIVSLFSTNFGSDPNVATYIVGDDPGHVVETQPLLAPDYLPWMAEFVDGDASWKTSGFDAGLGD